MMPLLAVAIAYLLGSIPFGYVLVKWRTGADVRAAGSGNIGATNVLRTTGRAAGVATLALDIAKGYAAVWIAGRLTQDNNLWTSAAALAVMAGHSYPVFLRFQGGKAVASFVGAFLRLTPLPLLAALLVFLAVTGWTRHVSLGSIVAAATLPVGVWIISHAPVSVLSASILAAGFIIYRHRSNIQRLREGTEHRFNLGVKRA